MWLFRAKQLWLTTPLAMKSPVPVVMSYIGSSMPSGSIAATRSFASLFSATPSIDRFRVIAGSVAWKNRMTSLSPPRMPDHDEAVRPIPTVRARNQSRARPAPWSSTG